MKSSQSKVLALLAMSTVIILGVLGVLALTNADNSSKPATDTNSAGIGPSSTNTIETTKFIINVPAGVTNKAITAPERGRIELNYERQYGTVTVVAYQSNSPQPINARATKTTQGALISGVEATKTETDLSGVVSGQSSLPTTRYRIEFGDIPLPSKNTTSILTIELLSENDVSKQDLTAFMNDADKLIKSFRIK